MAGMFYSLNETAQRLGKTEDEVRQLATEGRLREFRDGSNLLFKIEEVTALMAENIDMSDEGLELQEVAEEQPAEALEEAEVSALDEPLDEEVFTLDEAEAPTLEDVGEVEATSELGLAPEIEETETPADEDLLVLDEAEEKPAEPAADSSEEISLAAESGVLASESDITDMDTALTGEGVNVLAGTDADYEVTDDSMAETVGPALDGGATGTGEEASLEEIEDDVNLDSFGSGSGLLDLSLQADDTSLGGILDEIYTAEGGEEEPAAAAAPGEFDEIAGEADHPVAEDEAIAVPEPVAAVPMGVAPVYAEAAPDTQSNILGMLLFLPLLALLYTSIVTVAAMREVMPSVLASIQSMVWYITGGAIGVAVIVAAASFMTGREKAPRAAKPAKKAKAKKSKKEKVAKAEKPAKEKKSRFGKKKGK